MKYVLALGLALLSATVVMSSGIGPGGQRQPPVSGSSHDTPPPWENSLTTGEEDKYIAAQVLLSLGQQHTPLIMPASSPKVTPPRASALDLHSDVPLAWDSNSPGVGLPLIPQLNGQDATTMLNWKYYNQLRQKHNEDLRSRFKIISDIGRTLHGYSWKARDLHSTHPTLSNVVVTCSFDFQTSITDVRYHYEATGFHPSVVPLVKMFIFVQLGSENDPSTARPVICYAQKLVRGQSLTDYLRVNRAKDHSWETTARKILWQILSILESFQYHGRSLGVEADNFIINENGSIMVTNFERAKDIRHSLAAQNPDATSKFFAEEIENFGSLLRTVFTGEDLDMIRRSEQSTGQGQKITQDALLSMFGGNKSILELYKLTRKPVNEQVTFTQLKTHLLVAQSPQAPITPAVSQPAVAKGVLADTTTSETSTDGTMRHASQTAGKRTRNASEKERNSQPKRRKVSGALQVDTGAKDVTERNPTLPVPPVPPPPPAGDWI